MRPFSENAQCMKCGGRDVGVTWQHPVTNQPTPLPESMFRKCLRCGFGWEEAPLNLLVPTEAPK